MEIARELLNAKCSKYEINVHGRECGKCGEFKPWINEYGEENFPNDFALGTFGYHYRCKACNSVAGYYKIVRHPTVPMLKGRYIKKAILDFALIKGFETPNMEVEFYINKKMPTGDHYKVVGKQFEQQTLERI